MVKKAPIQVPIQELIDQPSAIMNKRLMRRKRRKVFQRTGERALLKDCSVGVHSFRSVRK
jgi:hypothetical protein